MSDAPRLAVWLVTLFSRPGDTDSILGDLWEEFGQIREGLGDRAARWWFWRQSLRTCVHLFAAGYRSAPWLVTGIAIGAFLLRWRVSIVTNPWVDHGIEDLLERCGACGADFHYYVAWYVRGQMAERLVVNVLVGLLVGLVAKEREMTATIALALLGLLLALQATLTYFARSGDRGIFGTWPWTLAFSMAVVVGGALVRMRRAARV